MKLLPDIFPDFPGSFLVGGCVRDLLLGRMPTDYDIAVLANPAGCARAVASALAGRVVEIGKPEFRIWRVVSARHVIDVTLAAGKRINEDLRQRDFTINAMAIDVAAGKIIDVTGGRKDLHAGIIRMVSPTVFASDPVRIVRAFRFAALLDFTIEPATALVIRREAGLIARSAGERIRTEILKLLTASHAQAFIADMLEAGVLSVVFPELGRQSRQQLEHSLRALRQLETLLDGFASFPEIIAARLRDDLTENRRVLMKLAQILYPIDPGLLRSYTNASGSRSGVLGRIRLSSRDVKHLEFLIRHRDLPFELFNVTHRRPRDVVRFFLATDDRLPDLLLLALSNVFADADLTGKQMAAFAAFVNEMLKIFFFRHLPKQRRPPPLTGDDLIRQFGLKPSPRFREILDIINEERLVRSHLTRAQALKLVGEYLARRR